jgi:hypothetical protein
MWLLCSMAEVKAILTALANVPFDEPYYIFSNSWTVANGLAIWSSIWKTTDWQIKGILLWGHEMWKHIRAAHQTIWVSPVDAHSKSLCFDETCWNQACVGFTISRLLPLLLDPSSSQAWQHVHHCGL